MHYVHSKNDADDKKDDVPPVSNRGVQNTSGNSLIALVDWVSVTFKKIHSWETVSALLGLHSDTFQKMDQGVNGYKGHMKRGHISILFDGGNADMGVHVQMSGQGCREYENETEMSWPEIFKEIINNGGSFTRLDLALDDYKGYFKPNQIVDKLDSGLSSSRFKSYRYMRKGRIIDGSSRGVTVYLGSEQSDVQIRIYDKKLERKEKAKETGQEVDPNVKNWIRTEIQLADTRATAAAQQVIFEHYHNGETIGSVIAGFLANYVNFYEKRTGDSNKSRWPQWERWRRYLGDAEKIKLSVEAPDRTMGTRKAWIDTQTKKTLGKLFLAFNSDLNWFIELLEKGMEALDTKDLEEIETYKRNVALIELHNLCDRLQSANQDHFRSLDEYIMFCSNIRDRMESLEGVLGMSARYEMEETETDAGERGRANGPKELFQGDKGKPIDYTALNNMLDELQVPGENGIWNRWEKSERRGAH